MTTIPVTTHVTIERVRDVLTSALEGGSNYWYTIAEFIPPTGNPKVEFRHIEFPTMPGGALVIQASDHRNPEREDGAWRLDLEACTRGLNVMASRYAQHYADLVSEQDDATTGDVFLQCALFGEVIFG